MLWNRGGEEFCAETLPDEVREKADPCFEIQTVKISEPSRAVPRKSAVPPPRSTYGGVEETVELWARDLRPDEIE